jgi:dihydrolipoamide dehydrogenase
MSEKILVPALGESITEATIAKWLKKKGDTVEADEPIVELETDKVNVEVPSPIDGVLTEINSEDGAIVEVGAILGSIDQNGSVHIKNDEIKNIQAKSNGNQNNIVNLEVEKKEPKVFDEKLNKQKLEDETLILTDEINKESKKIEKNINQSLSPSVRKIVAENKIDLQAVKGSGKEGRILKGDVINLMGSSPSPSERKTKYGQEERIKMTRLRQTIAKRLKQAQENAALLTTFNEVDMSSIMEMRKKNQEDFQKRYGIKLGFMSFFVKACVVALKAFPSVNAEIDGDEIVYKNYYNISFAVGTEKGLVVPVLKKADELSFADIEKSIKFISEKARDGKIAIDDLQGGTFTISNGGVYGSMLSTPILNLPQSGVLGMHNIVERPVVVDGEIKIRPIMYLALSYDHRIIDGKESVSFLKTIKENLAQLGLKTACIESRGSLGGTCLNVGCIPSKNLLNISENYHKAQNFSKLGIEVGEVKLNLEKMMKNKDKAVTILTKGVEFLFKKNKVTYFKGTGSFKSANKISILDDQKKETIIEAEKTVISTGSTPVELPGMEFDEKIIVSSTGALTLPVVPKKMIVVGGGYIGLEMGSVWSRLGAEVHVVEFLDHITPGMDREVSAEFMKILKKQGINFHMQTKVEGIAKNANGASVSTSDKDGKKMNFNCDIVLISVGRKPNTDNLNLDAIGVELDEKKRIKTDKKFQTNVSNVYAIGDVIDGPMLAHKAEDEGIAVAENIAGQSGHVNYDVIPGVVYTTPEVASIGKTEEQLKEANIKYKIGKFLFMANSRAKAIDEAEGFVKILADEKTDRVLGAHIIGPHAGELIGEIGVAMEFGASAEDIARTCHAHPTFSEAVKEAALSVDKRAIHS